MLFRRMKQESKNKKGFTLAELLVVVAILAILVAVSIPIFTGKLEESREATDVANMRAAKAAVVECLISDNFNESDWRNETYEDGTTEHMTYYDADQGGFSKLYTNIKPYGKGSSSIGNISYAGYKNEVDYSQCVIYVNVLVDVAGDAEITILWADHKNGNLIGYE